jgi:hypothetical protein
MFNRHLLDARLLTSPPGQELFALGVPHGLRAVDAGRGREPRVSEMSSALSVVFTFHYERYMDSVTGVGTCVAMQADKTAVTAVALRLPVLHRGVLDVHLAARDQIKADYV